MHIVAKVLREGTVDFKVVVFQALFEKEK